MALMKVPCGTVMLLQVPLQFMESNKAVPPGTPLPTIASPSRAMPVGFCDCARIAHDCPLVTLSCALMPAPVGVMLNANIPAGLKQSWLQTGDGATVESDPASKPTPWLALAVVEMPMA